ncbi:hypothetical protein L6452_09435 [Arctium lappa]|uniref:Uncharacterized protein n=1 Tax=Arctium lappa TaxID=4217 RepID=A0ACB9DK08_ARCLA|nr:hypothetical protein L6452_09435 [Arctium lappa]
MASRRLLSSVLRSSRSQSTHSGRVARTRSHSHSSPTGYLVERLRPGDDDKALSEVITHVFHRGKDEETEKKCGEDTPAVGRVTESEKLRRRLGSDGEASNHSKREFTFLIQSQSLNTFAGDSRHWLRGWRLLENVMVNDERQSRSAFPQRAKDGYRDVSIVRRYDFR